MPNVERLKMIQTIIERMARNSSAMKGWSITVSGALLALAASTHDRRVVLVALYAVISFASLDAYYLALERNYRDLYDRASGEAEDSWSLSTAGVRFADMLSAVRSASVWVLHVATLIVVLSLLILLQAAGS